MIPKQFDAIEKADIDALVSSRRTECKTLEYKESLPGHPEKDKKEFLADVSSFANASGGDIIYGVIAERDEVGRCTGVAKEAVGLGGLNVDEVELSLQQQIRDGIAPRIPVVRIRKVDGFANGPVLLIRVERSWLAPHTVTYKSPSRFFSRNSNGKYPLDVTEIRSAFALSESVASRIRAFRDERLAKIVAAETPVHMTDGPKIVLHLIPVMPNADQAAIIPLTQHLDSLKPFCRTASDERYNIDGLVRSVRIDHDRQIANEYVQLFRDGTIEACGDMSAVSEKINEAVEMDLIIGLRNQLQTETMLGVAPPFCLFVSLLGVKGFCVDIEWGQRPRRWASHPIDRDVLLLPDVMIEDAGLQPDIAVRPILDALWQASGRPKCINYEEDGRHRHYTPEETQL